LTTDTMMVPMMQMPPPTVSLPEVDKARFHLLIDDAISKQVWLGASQRNLHNLMCGLGGNNLAGDEAKAAAIARAEEEVARAQEETTAAIARLGDFM
jgi:hypothetical protein